MVGEPPDDQVVVPDEIGFRGEHAVVSRNGRATRRWWHWGVGLCVERRLAGDDQIRSDLDRLFQDVEGSQRRRDDTGDDGGGVAALEGVDGFGVHRTPMFFLMRSTTSCAVLPAAVVSLEAEAAPAPVAASATNSRREFDSCAASGRRSPR
jgi:hypothetical protein